MKRVRVSTTVDGDRLTESRRRFDGPDSKLFDRALRALIDELDAERELSALDAQPYESDSDLSWEPPVTPGLPYDGPVPPDVVRLAKRRRAAR
jgi:hypothetical protein